MREAVQEVYFEKVTQLDYIPKSCQEFYMRDMDFNERDIYPPRSNSMHPVHVNCNFDQI